MKTFLANESVVIVSVSLLLLIVGLFVLSSIAPSLFPLYLLFVLVSIVAFLFFLNVGFDVVAVFAKLLYTGSIAFLILPILVGQVTRGAVRWLAVGTSTLQPSELVRPFLLVFLAVFLEGTVDTKRYLKALALILLPVLLILIQPSLGVAVITLVSLLAVLFSRVDKRYILATLAIFLLAAPLAYQRMEDYQKQRVAVFLNPSSDPLGAGYNSIQAMIAVGSGKLFGRGLGKGVQTQLAFLPERHTDFIFASIGEELGLLGAGFILLLFLLLISLVLTLYKSSKKKAPKAYLAGFFVALLVQVVIHVGMNLGLLPITGVPLPLVSAGGSSLVATSIGLALALKAGEE